MTNLKIFSVIAIGAFALFGCKSTDNGLNANTDDYGLGEKKVGEQELQISNLLTNFFTEIFESEREFEKNSEDQISEVKEVNENPKFKEFNRLNTRRNVGLSINNNPRVAAALGKIKSYEAEISTMKTVKELTADIQAIGGLQTEDRETEAAATVILSTKKLLYDANSSDLRIESKNVQLKSGQVAALVAADLVALDALKAWVNLVRFKRVNKIFMDGFEKTQPLLEQIESISTSGLTDKKSLLVARRQVMELQDRFAGSKSMQEISEQVFLDSFSGADLGSVTEMPYLDINEIGLFSDLDLDGVPSVKEKLLLIEALNTNIKGLEASEKPQVAFRASMNAPLEDTLDEGTANAGLSLTYDFNDGGSLEAQIDQVKAELGILNSEIEALKKGLKVEHAKQLINYETSRDRLNTLNTLIDLSEEILETARQQLLSGRSTIKDILDAEVSLASLKIDKVNSEADIQITLFSAKTYKDGLTQNIGWSY